MSELALTPFRRAAAPDVEIIVPVYNEEASLAHSIRRLHRFLTDGFPFSWRIVIADNASIDATPEIAAKLAYTLPRVSHLRLDRKGRGRALRAAWKASDARVVTYMDVDLSTDLRGLLPLVAPLMSGHSDLAIGTRLAHGSRVVRGPGAAPRVCPWTTRSWSARATWPSCRSKPGGTTWARGMPRRACSVPIARTAAP